MHEKGRGEIIEKIENVIATEKMMEYIYKNSGIRFKREGKKLLLSKVTHFSRRWKDFEDVALMSVKSLAIAESELRRITKKLNKKKKKAD